MWLGLPWRLTGKEFTGQCRRHELGPWSRKIHVRDRKRASAPVTEPGTRSYCGLCTLDPCSTAREVTAMRSPHAATREEPAEQRRPRTAKKKKYMWLNSIIRVTIWGCKPKVACWCTWNGQWHAPHILSRVFCFLTLSPRVISKNPHGNLHYHM